MQPGIVAALAVRAVVLPAFAAPMPAPPYAGRQARPIKSLSDDDIAALRKSEGMGIAKAWASRSQPG